MVQIEPSTVGQKMHLEIQICIRMASLSAPPKVKARVRFQSFSMDGGYKEDRCPIIMDVTLLHAWWQTARTSNAMQYHSILLDHLLESQAFTNTHWTRVLPTDDVGARNGPKVV